MDTTKHKSLEQRLGDAQEVRKHLRQIGALQNANTRQLVTDAMNAFVRDGAGATLHLPMDVPGTRAILQLSARIGNRCGVTVECCEAPSRREQRQRQRQRQKSLLQQLL